MNTNFEQDFQDINYLAICCKKIAQQLGNGFYDTWKNSDYILLSSHIRRQTKIHISENTLKRIFGKLKTPEQYMPQKATRDALAQFAGYRDWEEFVIIEKEKRNFLSQEKEIDTRTDHKLVPNLPKSRLKKIIAVALGALLTVTVIYLAVFFLYPSKNNVLLICKNPEGFSPHSAIFSLKNAESIPLKSRNNKYEINFKSWHGNSTKIYDSIFSFYYEMPGVYYPILYLKKTPIDTGLVILNTKGWEITAQVEKDTSRVYPLDIQGNDFSTPPKVTLNDVFNAGVDTMRTFFVNFAWVSKTSISADDMELSTILKTSPKRPGVRCSEVNITLFGTHDKHSILLIKPECASWSYYKFSENLTEGTEGDLRSLGHDLTAGGAIKLSIQGKNVLVSLDRKLILKTSYTKPIGTLLGVNFKFSGVGEIQNTTIKSM